MKKEWKVDFHYSPREKHVFNYFVLVQFFIFILHGKKERSSRSCIVVIVIVTRGIINPNRETQQENEKD